MLFSRLRTLLWAGVIGLIGLCCLISLLVATPALADSARVYEAANQAPPAQPPPYDDWAVVIVFTDPAQIGITDLAGNPVGKAVHEGEVKCTRDRCSQKATLAVSWPFTDPWSLEYKFSSRQALDPEAERVIVAGTGTVEGPGQKERFTFIATFQNNRDGTVSVRYDASRPDASFIINRTLATFTLRTRR